MELEGFVREVLKRYGIIEFAGLIHRYEEYRERVIAATFGRLLELNRAAKKLVDQLLDSQVGKEEFIQGLIALDNRLGLADIDRFFFVVDERELRACLLWQSNGDQGYADEWSRKTARNADLAREFRPSDPNDRPPDVALAVERVVNNEFPDWDGIVPTVISYRRNGNLTPAESLQGDPYALFREWSPRTLVEFIQYLEAHSRAVGFHRPPV